ncbi:MAG: hypothetical protein H0W27_07845 [Actinobacteria bacterium]|nr:hypothetical protein [Actinomycetota bacterium]
MSPSRFDFLRSLRTLVEHEVRFVVIGGLAGRLHGSTTVTNDLDICYARDEGNLDRLARALRDLNARLRGVEDAVPFVLDANTLKAGDHFTFVTDAGSLDCLGTPAGVTGFEQLDRNATPMELNGWSVRVAAVDDLIRMKRAAGRPKDLIEVEVLGALRDEIESRRPRRR